jgi:hypothetical protein
VAKIDRGTGGFSYRVGINADQFLWLELEKKLKKLSIIINISSYILAKTQEDWISTE